MMGVGDPMDLSIGEWTSICAGWDKAHGKTSERPPSEDEFDAVMMAAHG
jgi:hypothetical protein